jgi:hypothetical protein
VIPKVKALTVQEIQKLDHLIDEGVPSQKLLVRQRDTALIHLLRFHESYMIANASTENRASVRTQPIMPTSEIF